MLAFALLTLAYNVAGSPLGVIAGLNGAAAVADVGIGEIDDHETHSSSSEVSIEPKNSDDTAQSTPASTGMLAGIIIVCIVVFAMVLVGAWFFLKKKFKHKFKLPHKLQELSLPYQKHQYPPPAQYREQEIPVPYQHEQYHVPGQYEPNHMSGQYDAQEYGSSNSWAKR
ncbi:hypothetical protein H4S06_000185 [Coemansia sp. BCRC 34490]|nr:hypothetical protein H4S06_000305 [Coemansia sp. BCRC 34490]KAJ2763268.1 hypothetical protein H4S06_000185 [Coemansia sp. BCRC 34490]